MQLGAWRVSSNANRNRRQRSDNEKETRRVGAMVKLAKAKEISMNTDTPVRARAIFFFSAPFSRRRSLVDDCFTGQSPGSAISIPAAPDVHEGLGQIQASAP